MKTKIEKIREGLYVKKSFDGYRVVHPGKNDDGTTNWFNVLTGGSWWNLAKAALILFLILGMAFGYIHDTRTCNDLIENPCKFLPNITSFCVEQNSIYTFPMLNGYVKKDGEQKQT